MFENHSKIDFPYKSFSIALNCLKFLIHESMKVTDHRGSKLYSVYHMSSGSKDNVTNGI